MKDHEPKPMSPHTTVEDDWELFRSRALPDAPRELLPMLRGCFIAGAATGAKVMACSVVMGTEPVLKNIALLGQVRELGA